MRVLGTAGHVDHGKSTLVHALTGIDPDRLKEEKERQMTIDLGFAWMTLPSGEGLGIVDVPGHRDFIENMLAGVGAIDAALLVVAADEGIMPQTREHLAILDLLEIPRLVLALTKTDRVPDDEWLELVRQEAVDLLRSTRYAHSELVPVSAIRSEGLLELAQAIDRAFADASQPRDYGHPRLPIDRAFTMAGFGTIVTGTLIDGELEAGQRVEIQPTGRRARIRGMQTHRRSIDRAAPASRVAINLTGVEVEQVNRGDVVSRPGSDRPTSMLDVRVRVLPDAPAPIEHDMPLKLFVGTAQRMVRARLYGSRPLQPGDTGWLRLLSESPLAVRGGDRLILRRPSPAATLGGGHIADAHPTRRFRRTEPDRLRALQAILDGSDRERLLQALDGTGGLSLTQAAKLAGLDQRAALGIVRAARSSGELLVLNPDQAEADWELIRSADFQRLADRAREVVGVYHRRYPARMGMPREELRSRLGNLTKGVIEAMVQRSELRQQGAGLSDPGFEPQLSASEQARLQALLDRFAAEPLTPPSVKECLEVVGTELFNYLLESGKLERVSEAVVFESGQYRQLVVEIQHLLEQEQSLTVAELRTRFGTTRKYALALLEHLDLLGITYRDGDVRRLVRSS